MEALGWLFCLYAVDEERTYLNQWEQTYHGKHKINNLSQSN